MTQLEFSVLGRPYPQGSKTAFAPKTGPRRAIMRESSAKGLTPWRSAITTAAREACDQLDEQQGEPLPTMPFPHGPVELLVKFYFQRPKSHYGTGRNSEQLKRSSPRRPTSRSSGDLSKLVRAIEDALGDAGVWEDDSQVVRLLASSYYCRLHEVERAEVRVVAL